MSRRHLGFCSKRLEYRPNKLLPEIDLALSAIGESKPEAVGAANTYIAHIQH